MEEVNSGSSYVTILDQTPYFYKIQNVKHEKLSGNQQNIQCLQRKSEPLNSIYILNYLIEVFVVHMVLV